MVCCVINGNVSSMVKYRVVSSFLFIVLNFVDYNYENWL